MDMAKKTSKATADEDKLELRYVPLSQAKLWDDNPKLHDIGALMRSIQLHGFGDPPKFDAKLEGLVYGNGRTEALARMREEGMAPPRGVVALKEDEDWAVPVIFGVDAESRAAAVAFAIDHNNLTLLGGNLGFTDLVAIWDEEGLQKVLADVPDAGALLASLDSDDIAALLTGPSFQPADADDQSKLDETRGDPVTCPECGASFVPER
jgi:hypothetical protein